MRVLFIVPYVPSLIRVRPFQLLQGLARRGHQLMLVAPWTNAEDRAGLQMLAGENIQVTTARLAKRRSFWNCLRALPSRMPLQSAYAWQPELSRQLISEVHGQPYDIIHVEHLRGALYGIRLLRERTGFAATPEGRTPVVWDSVDCITHLFRQARSHSRSLAGRLMTWMDLRRTEDYEAWLAGQFDRVLVTSPTDADALLRLAESRGIREVGRPVVLSNGVDLDYFRPANIPRDPATVVITGKMSYHANVTAVKHLVMDIMPLVWAVRPDVKVMIAGKDPPRDIRSLEARGADGRGNGSGRRVTVTGTVHDIRPYLGQATVAVAPLLYGAGVQNKVLEAMACGTPVVASCLATSPLNVRDGRDLLTADGPVVFAQQLLALLADPHLRHRLSHSGRRYVETFHNWDAVAGSLESVYLEAIGARTKTHACA